MCTTFLDTRLLTRGKVRHCDSGEVNTLLVNENLFLRVHLFNYLRPLYTVGLYFLISLCIFKTKFGISFFLLHIKN